MYLQSNLLAFTCAPSIMFRGDFHCVRGVFAYGKLGDVVGVLADGNVLINALGDGPFKGGSSK